MTNSNHLTHGFHQASSGGASYEEQNPPMMSLADTVRETHGLECPECHSDAALFVSAFVQVELAPRRYVPFGGYRINEGCRIQCMACLHDGTVGAFRVSEGEDIAIVG